MNFKKRENPRLLEWTVTLLAFGTWLHVTNMATNTAETYSPNYFPSYLNTPSLQYRDIKQSL
jgi:hypothetical protein